MAKLDELKHIAQKGQGYFCIVKKYEHVTTSIPYALKELKKEHYPREDYRYRLIREIKLLEELQGCENIIELVSSGHDSEKEKLWYLMPFATQNLYQYIKMHNATLTTEDRYSLIEQVVNAIRYAHSRGILHRDISPSNVLVFINDDKAVIKVSDFGLGKDTESMSFYTGSSASGYGQILYVSPEQKEKLNSATIKSDIFSLGKLVYFIFTGKDPDNIKQFELSSLVQKAIDENPENRFQEIDEFYAHLLSLKQIHSNQQMPIEYITLLDVINDGERINPIHLHELLVKGNSVDHVYSDYLSPTCDFLLMGNNLADYYQAIGNGIRDFVRTFATKLEECYRTTGWPFASMNKFGKVLKKLVEKIPDDEVRVICLKQLWYLAFESDQWAVQKEINSVLSDKFISKAIETQFAEYIINAQTSVDLSRFSGVQLPKIVKLAIIKGNENAAQRKRELEAEQEKNARYW